MVTSNQMSASPACPTAALPKSALGWMPVDVCLGPISSLSRTFEDNCPPLPAIGDTLIARDVKQMSDSNYVICGSHKYGEDPLCGFVMKLDKNGNQLWFRRVPAAEELMCVIESEARDGYIVCGKSSADGVVLRIAPDGSHIQWIHALPVGAAYDMARTELDEFVLVGSEWGPPNQAGFNYSSDVLVAKMNDGGMLLDNWVYGQATTAPNPQECDSSCYDQIFSEVGRGIAYVNDTVVVTGEIVTRPANCLMTDSVDLLVFTLDYNMGNVFWANRYNLQGTGLNQGSLGGAWDRLEMGEKVVVTDDRKIIVVGNVVHDLFSTTMPKQASFDGFVFECEMDGTQDSITFFGDENDHFLMRVALRDDDVPIAAGYSLGGGSSTANVIAYRNPVASECLSEGMNPSEESVPLPIRHIELDTLPNVLETRFLNEYQSPVYVNELCSALCDAGGGGNPSNCNVNMQPQSDHYWAMDTTAEKVLHPFLFEGDNFVEAGIEKVLYPFAIPDSSIDFILCKARATGEVEWTKRYGKANYKDVANSVKKTHDGNFIVAGVSESFSNHKNYPFLMKIDANGTVLWQRTYDGGHNLGRVKAVELEDGNFAACSYHNPWKYSETHEPVVFVVDPTGSLINYKRFGPDARNWDHLRGITPTIDGGFAVCGTNGHQGDYIGGLVVKFTDTGAVEWESVIQAQTSTGNFNLNSSNPADRSHLHFCDIVQWNHQLIVSGYYTNAKAGGGQATFKKGVLGEIHPPGVPGWFRSYTHDPAFSLFYNLSKTPLASSQQGVVVTGRTKNGGQQRTWVLKADPLGNPYFTSVYGGGNLEMGTWIAESDSSNILVAGFTRASSAASDYHPYHMRVDSNGHGADVCRDSVSIQIDDLIINHMVPHYAYIELGGAFASSFNSDSACIPVLDCDGNSSKRISMPPVAESDHYILFPNPGTDQFWIESYNESIEPVQMRIIDQAGRILKDFKFEGGRMKVDVEMLPAGIYFIRIEDSKHPITRKWIKL